MDEEAGWRTIEQQRLVIADLTGDLTDEQWESPSLCAQWRIRDVVAHIALTPQPPGPWGLLAGAVRARGNFDNLNRDIALRHAERPTDDLVAELRQHASSRKRPVVTSYPNLLFDTMVHGQDIAIPLGRDLAVSPEAAAVGASRVWNMGWPFRAKRRLRGFRLTATDTEWTVGDGADVRGPIVALLMLLTGRPAVLPRLTGDGLSQLNDKLTAEVGE
jgi:uncharacterized protein (TIGR03083 family)